MVNSQNQIELLAGKLKKLSEQLAPRVDLPKADIERIERDSWSRGEDLVLHRGPGSSNILFLSRDLQNRAALASLLGNQFPEQLSQEFLEGKFMEALFQLKGKQGEELWTSSKKCISELIAEIQNLPVQHEVIFPIINLWLQTGPLDFGPVTLYPRVDGDPIAQLGQDLDHPILRDSGLRAVKAYGIARVQARDHDRISSNALELAENAFNVIRLFRSYESYRWSGIIQAVVMQDSGLRVMWHRPIDDNPAEINRPYNYMIGTIGAGAPFIIRPGLLAWMRSWRFDEIASLCFSEPMDDVHRRIRDSVRWAGQAKVTRDNQARFLGQWIALEVLLNPYDRNPVGRDVSDAAAFLLSKPSVESRARMAKHFREFWTTRNAIVHQGKTVSEKRCETLASDVTRAVSALSRKHASGTTHIREWFESQKYSTVDDASPPLSRPQSCQG